MAYSSNLNKIQTDALDAKIQDLTLTGNVITNLLLTNKPKEFQGKNYTKVIATKNYVTESGTTTPATGLVQFDYAIPQTLGTFTMEPKFHKQEIAVDTREVAINNIDPKAAVKLKLSTTQEAANAFSHKMGTYLYGTTAAETTNATNSLRAIFDDGGEATTYGGVTRSSLADGNLNAYAPAGVGALTSSNDEYVITALSAARVGGQTPNLILTTDTIYNLYEGLLTKTYNVDAMRVSRGQMTRLGFVPEGNGGGNATEVAFSALYVHSAAIVADQLCPSTYMFLANLNDLTWRSVKPAGANERTINVGAGSEIKSVYSDGSVKSLNLIMRDWMTSEASYGETAVLILHGNEMTDDPRKHAKLIFA